MSGIEALRRWQAGACAMCAAAPRRLLVDHDHRSGLVRGLLCTSCNTAEGLQSAPSFVAYRGRPPAVMLGVEEQYGSVWDGQQLSQRAAAESNLKHADDGGDLFVDAIARFRRNA